VVACSRVIIAGSDARDNLKLWYVGRTNIHARRSSEHFARVLDDTPTWLKERRLYSMTNKYGPNSPRSVPLKIIETSSYFCHLLANQT
jgi:hypothetical protein